MSTLQFYTSYVRMAERNNWWEKFSNNSSFPFQSVIFQSQWILYSSSIKF